MTRDRGDDLVSVSPVTGEVLARHQRMSASEIEALVARCDLRQREWGSSLPGERSSLLLSVARELRKASAELAALAAAEMGKPVAQGRAEVEKCAWACEHYASVAAELLADEVVETDAQRSLIAWRPLGLVLAVMPWNFPFWQVFRFLAPNICAGNGAILKHAANVTGCAMAIDEVMRAAGAESLLGVMRAGHDAIERLIADPRVKAVTLTGSPRAGRAVAPLAAAALKKCVLELGGSDPYIVLEDADLDLAAEACATSRLQNAGQSCVAAKRFLAVEPVREDFTRLLVARMSDRRVGDPSEERTDIGPMARRDLRDALAEQVRRSCKSGARVAKAGGALPGAGAFFEPVVLTDVRQGMAAFDEETFGPVAAIVAVRDEAEAIALANTSVFGLGSAIFTRDLGRAERLAARLESGMVAVNTFVKSDPRLPFGGVKESGHGRELGVFGLREFANAQSVVIEPGELR